MGHMKTYAEVKTNGEPAKNEKTKQKDDGIHRRKKTKLQKKKTQINKLNKKDKTWKHGKRKRRNRKKKNDPKNPGTRTKLDRKKVVL